MSHHHHHTSQATSTFRLFLTMMLNFVITAVELIGGVVAGSLSLISDALHNFSDGVAIIISYIAIRLNQRPKTHRFTFGMKRAEIIAALINASVLLVICFYLFKEAYVRFFHPEPIRGGVMVLVAGIGLLANVIGTLLLRSGAKSSLNIRSAYLHLLSDAVSSLAVIIGGLFILFWNIYWVDPVLTVLIALYVAWESLKILYEALQVIMMAKPGHLSIRRIEKELLQLPHIRNIHHVHLWQLSDHDIHFEAHVDVEDMLVSESRQLIDEVEWLLRDRFHITHVTLQLECDACERKALV